MKRRRVNNLAALAVLSALAVRPMHPYEMATSLRAWGKEQDMAIKWGSFYTVVANLNAHGLIAAVESGRAGNRPERTVYAITEGGRAEMVDWARELVSLPATEQLRFRAGLSVLAALHPDEVVVLLGRRLELLEHRIVAARAALAEHRRETPRLFLIESEYDLAREQAEADWTRGLLAEIASGRFDGLESWRAFHETGAMPPEMAHLAQRGATETGEE